MVIIGAGQAGGRAALTLRKHGHAGRIVLIGDEDAAPHERPPLSKAFLAGKIDAADLTFASHEMLDQSGIDFLAPASAVAIDPAGKEVVLADGRVVPYERLLLATGRRVRRLSLPGTAGGRVHYLRTLADARRLRARLTPGARLLVIGGGFIGLEVASSAVERGCRVSLVEVAPRLLARAVPPLLAEIILARHRAAGVDIILGADIAAIDETGAGRVLLRLADGRVIEGDVVLAGIGAVAETGLAEATGHAVDRGILVDETLATSDPAIFAAGDVCAFPGRHGDLLRLESWKNADVQGALAARNMLGAGEPHREMPWLWSDQFELTLQIAGHPEGGTRAVERPVEGGRLFFHQDGAGSLVGVTSLGPASVGRESRLGQMLLERGLSPDPALLADPQQQLKAQLRQTK
jgi:3-phenylpropionate/trans-cinnamate dioxygenase ferredoxin reductase subunit